MQSILWTREVSIANLHIDVSSSYNILVNFWVMTREAAFFNLCDYAARNYLGNVKNKTKQNKNNTNFSQFK